MANDSNIIAENEGYKSLNTNGLERLRKLGKSDADLAYIDKAFKYEGSGGKTYNFANESTYPDISSYISRLNKSTKDATKGYCKMLRNCYPNEYYGSDNQGSNWLKIEFDTIYSDELLDKSKTESPTVPTFDKFCSYFKKLPYYTEKDGVGEFSERGIEALDVKYQQYLKDIWPEFWSGKIFDDRTEVTLENINNNLLKLCQYTYKDILEDTANKPTDEPIGEAHYFAIFCGNDIDEVLDGSVDISPYKKAVEQPMTMSLMMENASSLLTKIKLPNNLQSAENSVDSLIDEVKKLTNSKGGFPAFLSNMLKELTLPLVAGLVWVKVKPYVDLSNPSNIDPKQLSKDAARQLLQNFKDNTQQMLNDMTKEVQDTINEITITAKGLWDNLVSLPKTVASMVSTAALPQTIPTTGGIPNPITVILDIMNIIDSILALFPPIIQDILKILILCKKLMIPLDKLDCLRKIIDLIKNIIEFFKKKKKDATSAKQIHKAINKAEKQRNKLIAKRSKLVDRIVNGVDIVEGEENKDEYNDYSELIKQIDDNISSLNKMCPGGAGCTDQAHHGVIERDDSEDEIDFVTQLAKIESNLKTMTEAIDNANASNSKQTNGNTSGGTGGETKITDNTLSQFSSGTFGQESYAEPSQMPTPTPVNASPLQETNVTPYCGKVFTNI